MTERNSALVAILVLTLTMAAAGQDPEVKPDDYSKFPPPLESVSTNILLLEKSGHFRITKAEYRSVSPFADRAFVWTVVARRSLTYRLAKFHLEHARQVRFYVTAEKGRRELHSDLLYYPERISVGAANKRVVSVDEEIEVWLLLDDNQIRNLEGNNLDFVEFGPLPTAIPLSR